MSELTAIEKALILDRHYYDQWAATYDKDVAVEGYNGAQQTAEVVVEYVDKQAKILDVAAGTGTLARHLKAAGYNDLHAIEPSENMLEKARLDNLYKTYTYEFLLPNSPCSIPANAFDVVVTVGSFAPCHLDTRHLRELIRMAKINGLLIIGIRQQWLTNPGQPYNWNFEIEQEMNALESEKTWKLLNRICRKEYCGNDNGVIFVYRKLRTI